MRAASLKKLLLVGPLAFAGCYSPYGYQSPYAPGPYGQPYQPAYPGNPVYTAPPGQPYVPGGTTPGTGSPTPITPPSTYDPGGGGTGGSAPTFDPNPPASSGGGNRVVPNPGDDLNNGPAASNPGGLQPTSSQALESPFEQESNLNNAPRRPVQPTRVSEEADPFEMPERVSNGEPGLLQNVNYVAPPEGLNPYGRDTKHANPEWLRGVLDFDQKTKTWQITYAASPDPRDRNGGSLTLAKHSDLALSRSGDIVLIEGAIDAGHTDGRGKPLYMIDKVTPLATH